MALTNMTYIQQKWLCMKSLNTATLKSSCYCNVNYDNFSYRVSQIMAQSSMSVCMYVCVYTYVCMYILYVRTHVTFEKLIAS